MLGHSALRSIAFAKITRRSLLHCGSRLRCLGPLFQNRPGCCVLTGITNVWLQGPSRYGMLVLQFRKRPIQLTMLNLTSWRTITACNIVIEITLGAIPFWLFWDLQIKTSRKISVIAIFSLRTPYVSSPKVKSAYSPSRR